jgi:hypothetical protein
MSFRGRENGRLVGGEVLVDQLNERLDIRDLDHRTIILVVIQISGITREGHMRNENENDEEEEEIMSFINYLSRISTKRFGLDTEAIFSAL